MDCLHGDLSQAERKISGARRRILCDQNHQFTGGSDRCEHKAGNPALPLELNHIQYRPENAAQAGAQNIESTPDEAALPAATDEQVDLLLALQQEIDRLMARYGSEAITLTVHDLRYIVLDERGLD